MFITGTSNTIFMVGDLSEAIAWGKDNYTSMYCTDIKYILSTKYFQGHVSLVKISTLCCDGTDMEG